MKIPFNEIDRDLHKLAERRVEDAMNSVAQLLETKEQRASLELLLVDLQEHWPRCKVERSSPTKLSTSPQASS